ncbi:MAG: hypothetical protein J7L54_06290, partial [Elusimicrobia bacterium]|nr:hypothetical protein [Elusimicrobiota bacterium]
MKFLKFFPFIFFLCVGGISAGWVERVGTSGGEFLNLNFDARTVGMGNASSGFAFGVDSIKINPAGIAKMENQEISFSQVFWAEKVKFTAVSFAQPLGCGDFFIGFSLSGLWMDKIKKIDVYGNDAGEFSPY